jgi:hypothetical protein
VGVCCVVQGHLPTPHPRPPLQWGTEATQHSTRALLEACGPPHPPGVLPSSLPPPPPFTSWISPAILSRLGTSLSSAWPTAALAFSSPLRAAISLAMRSALATTSLMSPTWGGGGAGGRQGGRGGGEGRRAAARQAWATVYSGMRKGTVQGWVGGLGIELVYDMSHGCGCSQLSCVHCHRSTLAHDPQSSNQQTSAHAPAPPPPP